MPTHRLSCALVMAIMAVPLVSLRAQEIVRLTPANGRVAIWNLVGNARIEQGSAREVEVLITPRGSDGARMITRSGLIDGEQTLRIFYPVDEVRPASASRSRRSNASTTLRMRDDGSVRRHVERRPADEALERGRVRGVGGSRDPRAGGCGAGDARRPR
ncbi:MAG: hypothetical protein U5K74_00540 [Gemmatimonadaceae bacterium]|nr:hypothetical protein [Gemmatimonadaceae bacterium]